MRPIEFRAWLKDEKKMIEVKAVDFDENGDVFSVNYPEGKSYCGYDRDNIELMQYTGLKDKNGTKIFEGDVVKDEKQRLFVIEYRFGGFNLIPLTFFSDEFSDEFSWNPMGDMQCASFIADCCEAIDNIYENPELLGD